MRWGVGVPVSEIRCLLCLTVAPPTKQFQLRFPKMLAWAIRRRPHFVLPQTSWTDSFLRRSQLTVLMTSVLLKRPIFTFVVLFVLISGTLYLNVGLSA